MGVEDDLAKKYKEAINQQFQGSSPSQTNSMSEIKSMDFSSFKSNMINKANSFYEKACKMSESLNVLPPKESHDKLQEAIDFTNLRVTLKGVMGFSILGPLIFCLLGIIITFALWQSIFYFVVFSITFFVCMSQFVNIPLMISKQKRLKSSNQMVLAVFYIVTYMRHTSNLELAISFAGEHLGHPLSTDLNTILWNVESGKFSSIKEALDDYLSNWRKDAMEFVEAMHLIESSLYESSEDRRISLLDKALQVILEETYEKMIHYAHSLQSPITMLHMLGVILPILGLVILPLAVSFMEGIEWFHILAIYNIFLPGAVFYLGSQILSTRPSGGGSSDDSIQNNPKLKKYQELVVTIGKKNVKVNPVHVSIMIFVFLFLLGLSPVIFHALTGTSYDQPIDFGFGGKSCPITDQTLLDQGVGKWDSCEFVFLDYRFSKTEDSGNRHFGKLIGPFGIISSLISLFFPLAVAFSLAFYFKTKSANLIELRNRSKKLEAEFGQGLFQLGNRLGDGLPPELAFGKVAEVMEGTTTGDFFELVSNNIMKLGLGVYDAIFNPVNGALNSYPSNVIESSMKVLVQSAKKGPEIAARAVVNVSEYIKEMHKVEERLKDLMAETTSSMASQINFMTPAITGIVIGITSMVTTIMGKLTQNMNRLGDGSASSAGISNMLSGDGVPTYYFQAIVGIYVVQVTYILTVLVNGITNGSDKLQEQYSASKNLLRASTLYVGICFVIMILFNMIAANILKGQ